MVDECNDLLLDIPLKIRVLRQSGRGAHLDDGPRHGLCVIGIGSPRTQELQPTDRAADAPVVAQPVLEFQVQAFEDG